MSHDLVKKACVLIQLAEKAGETTVTLPIKEAHAIGGHGAAMALLTQYHGELINATVKALKEHSDIPDEVIDTMEKEHGADKPLTIISFDLDDETCVYGVVSDALHERLPEIVVSTWLQAEEIAREENKNTKQNAPSSATVN